MKMPNLKLLEHLPEHNRLTTELDALTDELLFQKHDDTVKNAAQRLYEFFLTFGADCALWDETAALPTGKALSPRDAARCVLDYIRTSKFLQGVDVAIRKAQDRFPNKKLEVVYAGCGPFATLVVPLLRRFDPRTVSFTLIDVHEESLRYAARVVEAIGATEHIKSYKQTDATTYQHDAPIDVLIIETMQRALEVEPQVAVTLNLARQLSNEGLLVPEEISVELIDANLSEEFSDAARVTNSRLYLGELLQLSKTSSFEIGADNSFVALVVEVAADDPRLTFTLFTKLKIFESIELNHYESGITFPHPLHDLSRSSHSNRLEFKYQLGRKPGFKYRWF